MHGVIGVRRRICVFCGARPGRDPAYVRLARDAATALVTAGFGLVYGGGRIGLMGALADAALAAGGEVIGVIPVSLATTEVAHRGITDLRVVESMHERKALMNALSDAFLALPGGYGTMDELFEALTWRQLGFHEKPVVLLDANGFYDPLLAQLDRMTSDGFVAPRMRELLIVERSVPALIERLRSCVEPYRGVEDQVE
jgi:uncharacterized protein (TIGR00730 family)